MKNEISLNPFFKYFIAVFIFLAVIVSLFPPYEWGNERLKTLEERRSNRYIKDKLPVKTYDLIFNSNKKYFVLDDYEFEKKYYHNQQIEVETVLKDVISFSFKVGTDTFRTEYLVAYKKTPQMILNEKRTKDSLNHLIEAGNTVKDPFVDALESQRRRRYDAESFQEYMNITNSENFNLIKKEFEIRPNDWTTRAEIRIDSIKDFRFYTIKKPSYYLLSRQILMSELIINYVLVFILSIAASFLITTFKERRFGNNMLNNNFKQ